MNSTGFVYFIRCQDRVKIGFSEHPAKRLTKVNADAPFPCELIGFVSAESFPERSLHKRFEAFHVHSEWFLAAQPVLDFIAAHSLCQPISADRFDRADLAAAGPLKRWRYAEKINQSDAASEARVALATWSRWENETRKIPAKRVLDVERITGVSRHELRPDIFGPAPSLAEAS